MISAKGSIGGKEENVIGRQRAIEPWTRQDVPRPPFANCQVLGQVSYDDLAVIQQQPLESGVPREHFFFNPWSIQEKLYFPAGSRQIGYGIVNHERISEMHPLGGAKD